MTLFELVSHLRNSILHDNGGTGVDWSAYSETDFDSMQLRWTNEELTIFVNEAINQVYRRANPIKDLTTLDISATENTYLLPSYIFKVLKVKRADGTEVIEKTVNDLWERQEFDTITGSPRFFIPDVVTNKVRIYPTPTIDETLSLLIYRFPVSTLSWDSRDDSPELRSEFQIPLLSYAAHMAYLKDEANTYDPTRAATFLSYFDREFPFTSVYSNIRKGRTTNKSIRYGGV